MRRCAFLLATTAIVAFATTDAAAQRHHPGYRSGNSGGFTAAQRQAAWRAFQADQMQHRMREQQREKHWHDVMHQIQAEKKAKAEKALAEKEAKEDVTKDVPKSKDPQTTPSSTADPKPSKDHGKAIASTTAPHGKK